ncbi:MAG TPA: hypothetical protein PKW35_20755 [Nannocystaceae bacterium]|nr:hypothetical protein [Nannocystaceae bacterium]
MCARSRGRWSANLAGALVQLGRAHSSAGDPTSAQRSLRRAAAVFAELRRAGAIEARCAPLAEQLAAAFPDG